MRRPASSSRIAIFYSRIYFVPSHTTINVFPKILRSDRQDLAPDQRHPRDSPTLHAPRPWPLRFPPTLPFSSLVPHLFAHDSPRRFAVVGDLRPGYCMSTPAHEESPTDPVDFGKCGLVRRGRTSRRNDPTFLWITDTSRLPSPRPATLLSDYNIISSCSALASYAHGMASPSPLVLSCAEPGRSLRLVCMFFRDVCLIGGDERNRLQRSLMLPSRCRQSVPWAPFLWSTRTYVLRYDMPPMPQSIASSCRDSVELSSLCLCPRAQATWSSILATD